MKNKILWVIGNRVHNPDSAINTESHWIHWLPDNVTPVQLAGGDGITNIKMLKLLDTYRSNPLGLPSLIYIDFVEPNPIDCFQFWPEDNWDDYKAPFESRKDLSMLYYKEYAVINTVLDVARSIAPVLYSAQAYTRLITGLSQPFMNRVKLLEQHSVQHSLSGLEPEDITEADYKQFGSVISKKLQGKL